MDTDSWDSNKDIIDMLNHSDRDDFDYYIIGLDTLWTYDDRDQFQRDAEQGIDEFRNADPDTRTIVPLGLSGGMIEFKHTDTYINYGDCYDILAFRWYPGDVYYQASDYNTEIAPCQ